MRSRNKWINGRLRRHGAGRCDFRHHWKINMPRDIELAWRRRKRWERSPAGRRALAKVPVIRTRAQSQHWLAKPRTPPHALTPAGASYDEALKRENARTERSGWVFEEWL